MDEIFVTTDEDGFGRTTLEQIALLGCKTRVLKKGQAPPSQAIAVFKVEREPGSRRPNYFCCSAPTLRGKIPTWAHGVRFGFGVVRIGDPRDRYDNFIPAVKNIVQMSKLNRLPQLGS